MKDNRLHRILEIITTEFPDTGIKYRWYYTELMQLLSKPWKKASLYQVKHLCQLLSNDHILLFHDEKDYIHMDHICLENARRAFHGQKYKEKLSLFPLAVGWARIFVAGSTLVSLYLGYSLDTAKEEKTLLREQNQKLSKQTDSLLYLLKKMELENAKFDSLQ